MLTEVTVKPPRKPRPRMLYVPLSQCLNCGSCFNFERREDGFCSSWCEDEFIQEHGYRPVPDEE